MMPGVAIDGPVRRHRGAGIADIGGNADRTDVIFPDLRGLGWHMISRTHDKEAER
jgi:hypothetical protein